MTAVTPKVILNEEDAEIEERRSFELAEIWERGSPHRKDSHTQSEENPEWNTQETAGL